MPLEGCASSHSRVSRWASAIRSRVIRTSARVGHTLRTSANSWNRHNPFANLIWRAELQSDPNNAGDPTSTARHLALEVATLSRFGLNRNTVTINVR